MGIGNSVGGGERGGLYRGVITSEMRRLRRVGEAQKSGQGSDPDFLQVTLPSSI